MISMSRTKYKHKRPSPSRDTLLSDAQYDTAFANIILACSSSWALSSTGGYCYDPPVCAATFYLLLIHSIVGVIRYGNPEYGGALRSLYENTAFISITVGFPCYAAQFGKMYSVPDQFVNSIIILAISVAAWQYLASVCNSSKRKGADPRWITSLTVRFIVCCSLAFVLVLSYHHLNYFGFVAAIAFSFNFFFTGTTGTVFNLPAIDMFLYQMTFFNIYSAISLQD